LAFRIPYTCDGRAGNYYPDLIVKLADGRGAGDPLEPHPRSLPGRRREGEGRKGADREDDVVCRAVNNLGTFGRWSFLEIDGSNLHKTKQEIRKLLKGAPHVGERRGV